jgi:hypothetical protein
MKRALLILATSSLLFAEGNSTVTEDFANYLQKAVEKVENARKEALKSIDAITLPLHDNSKESNASEEESISTKIVKAQALADIAANTAQVEIAKVHATTEITKAVEAMQQATKESKDRIEEASLKTIIDAVSMVEVAKAKASKYITEAMSRIEVSKTMPKSIPHEEQTLSIAQDLSSVKIAQSVAEVEVAKSNSYIEIAKSSLQESMPTLSKEQKEKLEHIKAKATAKISSYLTELEVLKAEVEAKIAKEMARVEISKQELLKQK